MEEETSSETLVHFYQIIALKMEAAGTFKDRVWHIQRHGVTAQKIVILIFPPAAR
jgi:hypothetical protein